MKLSEGSRCHIELLPPELVSAILIKLDTSTLASLRQVSKVWKATVDSSTALKSICVAEGLLTSQSQTNQDLSKPSRREDTTSSSSSKKGDGHHHSDLRQRGFSKAELASYWTLLAAHHDRSRGLPFREEKKDDKSPAAALRRRYFCSKSWPGYAGRVTQFKIDHIDRVIISTHEDSQLKVTCLEKGIVLDTVKPVQRSGLLDFSEGWIAASVGPDFRPSTQIRLWRFDRTLGSPNPKRGSLREHGIFSLPHPIGTYRFHFPQLVVFTEDMHLNIFDVTEKKLLRRIEVKPSMSLRSGETGWKPCYLEFDDEFIFVLSEKAVNENRRMLDDLRFSMDNPGAGDRESLDWCLQVFSRKTNDLVWTLDTTKHTVIPQRQRYSSKLQKERRDARWDQGTGRKHDWLRSRRGFVDDSDDEDDFDDPDFYAEEMVWGNLSGWPADGHPVGVHHDTKTGSLCVQYGANLILLPAYKKMLKTPNGYKHPYMPVILTIEAYETEATALATGQGLACFGFGKAIVLVDIQKVLTGRVRGSVVRFLSPEIDYDDDENEEMMWGDCFAIHLDDTLLAYTGTALRKSKSIDERKSGDSNKAQDSRLTKDGSDEEGDGSDEEEEEDSEDDEDENFETTVINTFDFAELGRLRSKGSKKADLQKQNELIELPA